MQKLLKEIQREEIKFQVLIRYYIEEIEERLKEHIAINKKIKEAFDHIESEGTKQLETLLLSYEHTTQSHIEKFTEALFETKADKTFLLKEDILNMTRHQEEIKELFQDLLKQIEHIKTEYMDKEGIIRARIHPLQDVITSLDITKYFKFIEMDLGLEKAENHLIRKLVSGISAVKKMVDKPYIEECKEKLDEGLKQAVETMTNELKDAVKTSLLQERKQILEIRQRQFDEVYGDDKKRINQLYALKTVEKLLSEPTRESTVVDYIKGMGETKWNNILKS